MSNHDTYNLQSMMETCVRFLEVNNFSVKGEPKYETISNKKFVKFVEKRLSETDNELFNLMDSVNIEITFRSALSNVFSHKDDPEHHILVLFFPDDTLRTKKFGKDAVKKFLNLMLRVNCKDGVLISEKEFGSAAKKEFERCNIDSTLSTDLFNVIFYNDGDFINIVDHISCPRVIHIYRTKEEIDQFERENRLKISNLPGIESTDPLTKFFRGKIGNIFELERPVVPNNVIANRELSYRIVIPPGE